MDSLDKFRPPGSRPQGLTHKCRLSLLCRGCCGCVCAGCWGYGRTVHTADMGTASTSMGDDRMQSIRTVRQFWVRPSSQMMKAETRMPQDLKICSTHHAQSTRKSSIQGGYDPTGQKSRESGAALCPCGYTYPTMALFHVGHIALPIRNPLLALLAGPASVPQPGPGLTPAMGFWPAPAARGQGAAPSSHISGWGFSGNSRARAA